MPSVVGGLVQISCANPAPPSGLDDGSGCGHIGDFQMTAHLRIARVPLAVPGDLKPVRAAVRLVRSSDHGHPKEGFMVKPLVLEFVRQTLPSEMDKVQRIFSAKGAYATFKDLMDRNGALDQWYDFEAKAEEEALRMWCALNSIELSD